MSLRDRQKATTRALILAAAAEELAERGYEGATTRAVATRAGVGAGTVFLHFPDKGALVEALLHDHIQGALDRAFVTLPAGDVVSQLVHVAETLYEAYDAQADLSRALLAGTLFVPAAERPLGEQLRVFERWVGERIEAAVAAGEIPPIPPPLAFAAFFSAYFTLLIGGLRGELPPAARPVVLDALLRRSLRAPELSP